MFFKSFLAFNATFPIGVGMEWYTKSFTDCILDEDPECSFNSTEYTFSRAVPYFCGQDPRCLYYYTLIRFFRRDSTITFFSQSPAKQMGIATSQVYRRARIFSSWHPRQDEWDVASPRALRTSLLCWIIENLLQQRFVQIKTSILKTFYHCNPFVLGYGRRHENRYIKSKPALSEQVLAKLRNSLSDEYELYEFCQQRLYHQYQQTINVH